MQTPTIGRIVHYRLSEKDAEAINRRRVATDRAGVLDQNGVLLWPNGAQRHVGSYANKGDVVALTITKVWPEEYGSGAYLAHHEPGTKYESPFGVNGQATLDGNDTLWVTSAPHGDLDGCWNWPPRA